MIEISTSRLPIYAMAKLSALQVQAEEANTLAFRAKDRIAELEVSRRKASIPAIYENLTAELGRQKEVMAGHQQRHRQAAGLVAKINSWINASPNSRYLAVAPFKLKPKAAVSDIVQDVKDVRENIAAMKRERDAVDRAPPPKKTLHEMARTKVDELAARGRPQVVTTRGGLSVDFRSPDSYGLTVERIASMLAWLDPDAMTGRLIEMIDALPEVRAALPPSERQRRLTALDDEIASLENQEECLICAASDLGQTIWRRPDASPAAILGVKIATERMRTRAA